MDNNSIANENNKTDPDLNKSASNEISDLEKEMTETNLNSVLEKVPEMAFKRPVLLVGKRGRLPRKLPTASTSKSTEDTSNTTAPIPKDLEEKSKITIEKEEEPVSVIVEKAQDTKLPVQQQNETLATLSYKEPSWSGLPETNGKPYTFEVLKNGRIIETIDLMKKPYWVFGRLANCDICMQHPTISRYHAVLQYRDAPSETDPPGFYIYDLGSTHGTFLNGKSNKLKPKIYAPIRVGHMLRLGCSQRSYILTGPEDDQEEESELSVTELRQLRAQKIRDHEEKMKQAALEREEKRKKEEEKGVDWGMGDDADETEDLSENPYASTNNEELYLDDPKKALRGFFEREGLELEYDCSEQGFGQFLCKVALPLDDETGRPIVAEVVHRGKKKEAVIQCALEACRILDRFGVLRQATHESRKRKTKNWEENDYYDSDDDTFLDRTGTVEKKREKRMKAKEPEKVETYESLLTKEKEISTSISEIEKRLSFAQAKLEEINGSGNSNEDSLDSYMKGLQEHKPDRQTISKLKFELAKLKKDHTDVVRLANIAKPADLPPLEPYKVSDNTGPSTSAGKPKQSKPWLPVVGKRKGLPVRFPLKPADGNAVSDNQEKFGSDKDFEVESEDEEEEAVSSKMVKGSGDTQNKNEDIVDKDEDMEKNIKQVSQNNIVSSNGNTACDNDVKPGTSVDVLKKDESNIEERPEDSNVVVVPQDDRDADNSDSDSDSEDGDGEVRNAAGTEILDVSHVTAFHETATFKKFENIVKSGLPPFAGRKKIRELIEQYYYGKHREALEKILSRLKRLATNEDRMHIDWKTLSAKKRKVMKLISDLRHSESNEKLEHRVSSELNRILGELNLMTEEKFKVIGKVKKMGQTLQNISMEIDKDIQALKSGISTIKTEIGIDQPHDDSKPGTSSESHDPDKKEEKEEPIDADDKKKKKNQKRIEQRQQKAEMERQRGYEEDATRENYSMWVPPNDQSGDGRTNLNEKYGY